MKKNRIRPLAICVFRNRGRILVNQGYDSVKDEYFFRPLGGGIEFGETGMDAVCRELMEELDVEVDRQSLIYLGTVENIFTFLGKPHHEIIMIYDGALKQTGLYDQDVIVGREANDEEIRAVWMDIDAFGDGKSILYPGGLLKMLAEQDSVQSVTQ
jgi:8-oxo-dGTP pyrophosphatase MutT (NUDIX family)